MLQRFLLDRRRSVFYLGLMSLGCAGVPVTLLPVTARSVSPDEAREWQVQTTPSENRLHRFKWSFRDERASAGGRGSVRIAPPDSLRFDVAGPFNSKPTAAVIIGDQARWTDPEDTAKDLLPNYPLMWAMFGVARAAEPGDTISAWVDEDTRVWQYTAGPDTVQYAQIGGAKPKFLAMVRHAGKLVGQVESRWADDGTLQSARLTVPNARLSLEFYRYDTPEVHPEGIWWPSAP